jgi:hypothetical protein
VSIILNKDKRDNKMTPTQPKSINGAKGWSILALAALAGSLGSLGMRIAWDPSSDMYTQEEAVRRADRVDTRLRALEVELTELPTREMLDRVRRLEQSLITSNREANEQRKVMIEILRKADQK